MAELSAERGAARALSNSHPQASPSRPTLQRSVQTSGGEWEAFQFEPLKDFDQFNQPVPAEQGTRGVNIMLRFVPNDEVDAELIGLSQTVQSFVAGELNMKPGAEPRAIAANDAQPIDTGTGETDEGTALDQSTASNNPLYAVDGTGDGSLTDPADSTYGHHGWHYTDASNELKEKEALLKDTPRRVGAHNDSRQVFETTALATKGVQEGTYYGSVRWGWRTDAAGNFTKIELQKVSDGVPSSTFLKAADLWNRDRSAAGDANIDLPLPDVKVTTEPISLQPPAPQPAISLPTATRLQVIRGFLGPVNGGTLKVVDGPHVGVTGEVRAVDWGNLDDERR